MSALFEALVNTLPPAIAIVALIYVLMRWAPGLNAATRYAVWCVTLIAVLALPALTRLGPIVNKPYRQPANAGWQRLQAPARNRPINVDSRSTVPLAAFVWAAGTLLMLLRLAASYRSLRRLKRQASLMPLDTPEFSRPLRVMVSSRLSTPIAAGFLHPAIVVPADLAARLSASELDGVLIHEYAHLARRDDWVNLAGRLLQALVWFHPLVWFCLRQIARERELACDDWVVHRTGNARAYAATLLKLTELRQTDRPLALATGILGGKSQLSHRIEELLRRGHRFVPAVSRWRLALATLFVSVLAFGSLPELPGMIKFQRHQSTPAPRPRQSFLAGLQAAGYGHLDVDEVIELHNHGVQSSDVRRAARIKSGAVTIEEIIRYKTPGILNHKQEAGIAMKTAIEATLIAAAALGYLAVNEATEILAQQQPQRNGWTIGRSRSPDQVRFGIDRSVDTRRTSWNSDLPWSSFQGLTPQQLSRLRGSHTFEFVREAGTFVCTGQFSGGRGHGAYRFEPNRRYMSQLQELGFPPLSSGDVYALAFHDVPLEFARLISAAGLSASIRELLELRSHGLSAAYLRDAQAAGFGGLKAHDYIEMHNHGVRPEFLRHLKNAGYVDISVQEIVEMRNHGIDAGYLKDLARHGLKPAPHDLVEMKNQGVSPRYLNTLAQAGLGQLDTHEVVELRNQNVTPEFILEAKALGYRFSGREMIQLRNQGVDGAYLRKLKDSGFQNMTAGKIAKLRTHGID